jgi:hypothetical protein
MSRRGQVRWKSRADVGRDDRVVGGVARAEEVKRGRVVVVDRYDVHVPELVRVNLDAKASWEGNVGYSHGNVECTSPVGPGGLGCGDLGDHGAGGALG